VACSTAKAIEWDIAWSDPTKQDQSGRFVDTHDDAVKKGNDVAVKKAK
jgi:hypothetical protein